MSGAARPQRRGSSKPIIVVKEKYLSGPPLNIPAESITLGEKYLRCLEDQPERIHQVDAQNGITETRGSLRERAIQLANNLCTKGIRFNDRVLISSKCHLDMTVTLLACFVIGAIVVPIYVDLTTEELCSIIGTIVPKMAFCDLRTSTHLDRCLKKMQILTCAIVVYGNDKKADMLHFNQLADNKSTETYPPSPINDMKMKACIIFMTEGTTGEIKLCECSEYAVFARARIWLDCFCYETVKLVSYLPINSCQQIISICASFESAIGRVLPGAVFNERNCCKLVHDLQIDTVVLSTEYALQLTYHHAGIYDFNISCLKRIFICGFSLSNSKIKLIIRAIPTVEIFNIYGLTEAGTISYALLSLDNKSLTVGKLAPGLQIYVNKPDTNEHLGPNVVGQIMIGGPQLMIGYYKNPHLNTASFRKGFFRAEDLISFDTEGNICVRGNAHDVLFHDEAVMPALELEDTILKCRSIKEVAILSNKREIVACIITREDCEVTIDTLISFLQDKVDEMWLPDRIQIFDHFPRTSMGKIKKYLLIKQIFDFTYELSDSSSVDGE